MKLTRADKEFFGLTLLGILLGSIMPFVALIAWTIVLLGVLIYNRDD